MSVPNEPLIERHDVQKAYGRTPVPGGGSLVARAGEVLCLTGNNGAGKSTPLLVSLAVLAIVPIANIDIGWLQNPVSCAGSLRQELVESLPGFGPMQIASAGAFTTAGAIDGVPLTWVWFGVLMAWTATGFRIRSATTAPDPVRRGFYFRTLVIAYTIWIVFFEAVGFYAATLETYDLTLWIDRAIPVVPEAVWVYDLCYLLPLLAVIFARDGHSLNRLILAIALATLGAAVVYLAVPVAYPLPELGGHSLSERFLAWQYSVDFRPGANKLPSLHVANAWLVWLALRTPGRRSANGAVFLLLAVLVSASTLLVKQHLIVDVATGIPWGLTAWWLAGRLYGERLRILPAPQALKILLRGGLWS